MSAVPRKTLGRFEIVRVLGKGAMGVVYEGRDPRLNRRVAIKTILRSAIGDEQEAKEYAQRFIREAQAVARLSHPNIVGVYDFGDEGDVSFIVMEFLEGRDLKSYLDAGHRFDFPTTVRLMAELLDGLGYAHRHGVIHRDVKPANIMIDNAGRVKLTDFGVARITESTDHTQAGTMVGTPSYMSPEQIQGLPVDNRTDLFAAGVILYQLVTGERPFAGAGTWTIYNQILQHDPKPPTSVNTALPPAVDHVLSRALAKSRDDRYRNAEEFSSALTGLLLGTTAGEGTGEADADATRFLLPADARRFAESAAQRRADQTGPSATSPGSTGTLPPGLSSQAGQEIELEFWRSIKDSTDPADFDLYLEKFPAGVYAALAQRKAQRLRNPDATLRTIDDSASRAAIASLSPSAASIADDATVLAPEPAPPPAQDLDRTVVADSSGPPSTARTAPAAAVKSGPSMALIGGGATTVLALAVGAWVLMGPGSGPAPVPVPAQAPAPVPAQPPAPPPAPVAPTPAPVTQSPPEPPAKAAAPARGKIDSSPAQAGRDGFVPKVDDDALQRIESAIERANVESADKAGKAKPAADPAAAAKAAAARAASERAAAERAAAKAAADRAAAERAAAERVAAERAAAEKAAAERAALDKAAAEKAAAAKLAAERAAAEKAAIERAAAEKAAAEKVAAAKAAAERAAAEKAAAERAAAQRLEYPATGPNTPSNEPAKRAGGRQN